MAGGTENEVSSAYSTPVGLVYVFNLIVGTGALALPKAFEEAGYVLSIIILVGCAAISYIAATFVLESLSLANAQLHLQNSVNKTNSSVTDVGNSNVEIIESNEVSPLLTRRRGLSQSSDPEPSAPIDESTSTFHIKKRVELSQMASMFLGKAGFIFFQVSLIVYLFGDLSVYSTAVPKSLMTVICTYHERNGSCLNASLEDDMPCLAGGPEFLNRINMYRFMVAVFAVVVGPFVFLGFTKTKYLQVFTTLCRWIAFVLMTVLAVKILVNKQGAGRPLAFRISGFSSVFGVSIYAFMCHHSLPSIVTPIRQKEQLQKLFMAVYVLILLFYATLSITGIFAFASLQDVYTLSFLPPCITSGKNAVAMEIADYFLALFPVFTITMNFPIVAITLSRNLRALWDQILSSSGNQLALNNISVSDHDKEAIMVANSQDSVTNWFRSYGVSTTVLLLPIAISFATDDVEVLASITGGYAGVAVQYMLPSMLIIGARKALEGDGGIVNEYSSPFRAKWWPILILVWSVCAIIFVTANLIFK